MLRGFATIIGLLIATVIMVMLILTTFKIYNKTSTTGINTAGTEKQKNTPNIINRTQDTVNQYQQKSIEQQDPKLTD